MRIGLHTFDCKLLLILKVNQICFLLTENEDNEPKRRCSKSRKI